MVGSNPTGTVTPQGMSETGSGAIFNVLSGGVSRSYIFDGTTLGDPLPIPPDSSATVAMRGATGDSAVGWFRRNGQTFDRPIYWPNRTTYVDQDLLPEGATEGKIHGISQENGLLVERQMVGEYRNAFGQTLPFRSLHGIAFTLPFDTTHNQGRALATSFDNAYIAGQARHTTLGIWVPVYWTLTNDQYQMNVVGGFPTNREGRIVGVREDGVMVGYMEPAAVPEEEGAGAQGQTFVFKPGQAIKWLPSIYGPPSQLLRANPGSPDDSDVQFVGNSPVPYVWIGSKTLSGFGEALDLGAFTVPYYNDIDSATVTGIGQPAGPAAPAISGANLNGLKAWAAKSSASYFRVATGEMSLYEVTTVVGTTLPGSDSSFAMLPDGRVYTVERSLTASPWKVHLEASLPLNLNVNVIDELSIRASTRFSTTSLYLIELSLWDYTVGV
ncbi:MAG: hypothetical protein KIT11_07170 [Fimbriimonadaceae bacterium]|nr:hypothetical protein [Fimbriimonadaceae bacterium]QYK56132.1 MAG: hypothetical protein KF733_01360 [Fimbriimonadaceae bacterium]